MNCSFRSGYSLSSSQVCEFTHTDKSSCVKCLGYWWSRDLLSNRSVEENIEKARECFFQVQYSRVSFQGDINPLSTKSVIDTCVISVLLYGCDNWILMEKSVQLLESFLGWMAKRALKWPQHLSQPLLHLCHLEWRL